MVIYEQCNVCGHQDKRTTLNGASYSSRKCTKCGAEDMRVQIGSATEPKWWKK